MLEWGQFNHSVQYFVCHQSQSNHTCFIVFHYVAGAVDGFGTSSFPTHRWAEYCIVRYSVNYYIIGGSSVIALADRLHRSGDVDSLVRPWIYTLIDFHRI